MTGSHEKTEEEKDDGWFSLTCLSISMMMIAICTEDAEQQGRVSVWPP